MRMRLAPRMEAKSNPKELETQPDTGMFTPGAISFTSPEVTSVIGKEKAGELKASSSKKKRSVYGAREEADLEKRGRGTHSYTFEKHFKKSFSFFMRKKMC